MLDRAKLGFPDINMSFKMSRQVPAEQEFDGLIYVLVRATIYRGMRGFEKVNATYRMKGLVNATRRQPDSRTSDGQADDSRRPKGRQD